MCRRLPAGGIGSLIFALSGTGWYDFSLPSNSAHQQAPNSAGSVKLALPLSDDDDGELRPLRLGWVLPLSISEVLPGAVDF